MLASPRRGMSSLRAQAAESLGMLSSAASECKRIAWRDQAPSITASGSGWLPRFRPMRRCHRRPSTLGDSFLHPGMWMKFGTTQMALMPMMT